MRLFVAVNLPDQLQGSIETVLTELAAACRRYKADIKWTPPERCHFTLKFLGYCFEEKQPELEAALQSAVAGVQAFPVELGGLGCFPEQGPMRVIWLGLLKGSEAMAALAERVESACESLGFRREERAFSAHITLGRVKNLKDREQIRRLLANNADSLGMMTVGSIELVQSVLSATGPRYTTLQTFKLN